MTYSIKYIDSIGMKAGLPETFAIPEWLLKRIPKGMSFTLHKSGDVWRLNGKVISRFDEKSINKAVRLAIKKGGAE